MKLKCLNTLFVASLFLAVYACQGEGSASQTQEKAKTVDQLIAELKKKHPKAKFEMSKSGLQYFIIK